MELYPRGPAIEETTKSTKKAKTAYEQLSDQLSELQKTQKAWATQNKDISDITARVAGVQLQIDKIDELIKKQTEAAMFSGKYGGTYTPGHLNIRAGGGTYRGIFTRHYHAWRYEPDRTGEFAGGRRLLHTNPAVRGKGCAGDTGDL